MRLSSIVPTLAALAAATASAAQPDLGYAELYKLQQEFYNRFLYPNNVQEAQSINSTVFSEDIQGRVSDTRNFVGRELNTEYIFGLFTPSESVTIIGRPVGPFEIIQFAANQNIASATTRVNFTFPSFKNIALPVTVDTWMAYNEANEISQYDVTFRWFGNLMQELLHTIDPDPVKAQAAAKDILAGSICSTHSKYCSGQNSQYDSEEACRKFLAEDIRFGQSFELGMDTLLCRNIHEIMVKFRPDVHCSHIGRTGGGQCADDYTYAQKVNEVYFTNAPWVSSIADPLQYSNAS